MHRLLRLRMIHILLGIVIAPIANRAAAEPAQISIQGKLQNAAGAALTGTRAFRVRFFNAATNGTQLGANVTGTVALSSAGRFSLIFAPPTQILNQSAVFYELGIDSATPVDNVVGTVDVFPTRVQVTSVPFALNSGQLGGVGASSYVKTTDLASSSTQTGGSTFWRLGGNTITDPATQFFGSSNNSPLEFRANNLRAARFESTGISNRINVVLGHPENSVTSGASGAAIGGGGTGGSQNNRVTDDFGTVAGGVQNQAGDGTGTTGDQSYASVGGGFNNLASGFASTIAGGQNQLATSDYAAVGGGNGNMAIGTASTVSGGQSNQAIHNFDAVGGGSSNTASGTVSTVSGGQANQATNIFAVVAGGAANTASGPGSTVGGGQLNQATNVFAAVGGGDTNRANGYGSAIPGGINNRTQGTASLAAGERAVAQHNGAFVWADNTATTFTSTANNQFLIRAAGGVGINKNNPAAGALDVNGDVDFSGKLKGSSPVEIQSGNLRAARFESTGMFNEINVVLGNPNNSITPGVSGATIGGGGSNNVQNNRVTDDAGTIAGGIQNQAGDGAGTTGDKPYASVGGGFNNTASGGISTVSGGQVNRATNSFAFVGGGNNNTASGNSSTVGGGQANQATNTFATVGGGAGNHASGHSATVAGGNQNVTSGSSAMIPGGLLNIAKGDFSLAAGKRAQALHNGAFVWGDSTDADFASTANNQFLVRAAGGVGINKTNPAAGALDVNGDLNFSGNINGKAIRAVPATGQRLISGIVQGNGSIFDGVGFTVSHTGTGVFTISYVSSFGGNPMLTVTPLDLNASPIPIVPLIVSSTSASATLRFFNLAGTLTDPVFFHFIIAGP